MTDGELDIFAYVRVQTHYIAVPYRLHILSNVTVKMLGFGPTPIQSLASDHGRVSDDGMSEQIVGSIKLTFPLYLNPIACPL